MEHCGGNVHEQLGIVSCTVPVVNCITVDQVAHIYVVHRLCLKAANSIYLNIYRLI